MLVVFPQFVLKVLPYVLTKKGKIGNSASFLCPSTFNVKYPVTLPIKIRLIRAGKLTTK